MCSRPNCPHHHALHDKIKAAFGAALAALSLGAGMRTDSDPTHGDHLAAAHAIGPDGDPLSLPTLAPFAAVVASITGSATRVTDNPLPSTSDPTP
jgi:hypothetical protein